MPYPRARRLDLVEDLHGRSVADPYRWLEDPSSPETAAWSAAQDALARSHLDPLPGREHLRRRLHELLATGTVGPPLHRGDRAFFTRRQPGQEHAVLLVREPDGAERALVDPSRLSDDDGVTLDGWAPSNEGDRLAYLLSEGGDEESSLYVMEVDGGTVLDGPVDRARYADLAWLPGGEELLYVRRLPPSAVPAGEEQFHRRVYRHRVGNDAERDQLVFGDGRDPTEYYGLDVSPDGRWLVVGASKGTAPRNDVYLCDLTAAAAGPAAWTTIQEGVDAWTDAGVRHDGRLYLLTDDGAPSRRLAVAEPGSPGDAASWEDLVPESDAVLQEFVVTDDDVVVASTVHAVARLRVHDRVTGHVRFEATLPGLGSVAGLYGRLDGGSQVWFGYTDFVTPPSVHRCDLATAVTTAEEEAPGHVEVRGLSARQVSYRSGDGTEARMFLLTRDDDPGGGSGPRPTVLYGYGGFGVSLAPAYSAGILAWVERGGVYAVANLRGGGEEGEAWHRAGMREHKANVFDDFAAAAHWLTETGITGPDRLGVSGGSNGGLLVGAALTRFPERFAAAVCSAPLLDMVRYERFGLGRTWNDEYGSAADPEELEWLLSYSPYHHVEPGTRYPAVLFTVFDSDTRVDPLHARKMCAALQAATSAPFAEAPVLLRREGRAGHGARSVSRTVELGVDTAAFLADRLGLALPDTASAVPG